MGMCKSYCIALRGAIGHGMACLIYIHDACCEWIVVEVGRPIEEKYHRSTFDQRFDLDYFGSIV